MDAAIAGVRQESVDASKPVQDDSTKIEFGRGQLKATITGDSIVETKISDNRPVEGPRLGMNDPKPSVTAKAPERYSGKAGR